VKAGLLLGSLLLAGALPQQQRALVRSCFNRADLFSLFSSVSGSSCSKRDEPYMKLALRHAQAAYRAKEVPIGAVVVDNLTGDVLSTARNNVERSTDSTAHAELLAIRRATQVMGNWRLNDCTLYTTLEPCAMCMGAIQSARLKRIVFGTKDHRMGACGSWVMLADQANSTKDDEVENEIDGDEKKVVHPFVSVQVDGGLFEAECSDIIKRFFQWRRREQKRNYRKKLEEEAEACSRGSSMSN